MFQRTFAECGDLGVFTVGRRRYYLASSVELAHELLVKNGEIMDKPERFRIAMRPCWETACSPRSTTFTRNSGS